MREESFQVEEQPFPCLVASMASMHPSPGTAPLCPRESHAAHPRFLQLGRANHTHPRPTLAAPIRVTLGLDGTSGPTVLSHLESPADKGQSKERCILLMRVFEHLHPT